MAAISALASGDSGGSARAPDRGNSCDGDSSQSQRIQEVASEVLRLRLVQSQHRQLEGQLRASAEKLRSLPLDTVLQLRRFLEQGLRPIGGPGTLGGSQVGGVDPESLLGLMECLCVVCNEGRVTARKQDDLLAAAQVLLQDPHELIETLIKLPPAQSSQTRRLAPFLLSCDGGWRGQLSEAGQCYETIRSWLSCYYQFSLINGQMQATSEQLLQQEKLLEELSRDNEGGTGGVGGSNFRPIASSWHPAKSFGVRRSSSCQSNESTGSRRSQSPADRSTAGLRPSPRAGAGPSTGRLSTARESPAYSPLKKSGRGTGIHSMSHLQRIAAVSSPGRSNSPPPLQPSSSRTSLHRDHKVESSPRAPRFGPPLSMTGVLGSARVQSRAGAPPPNPSPRVVRDMEPPKTSGMSRRQNAPAVRARRSPSRDHGGSSASGAGTHKSPGPLSSRVTPLGSRGHDSYSRSTEHRRDRDLGFEFSHGGELEKSIDHDDPGRSAPGTSSRASLAHSPSLARSRSFQGISEPHDSQASPTPPMSCRGQNAELHSARRAAQGMMPIGRMHSGSSTSTPQHTRPEHRTITSGPSRMTRFTAPPSAGSGSTSAGAALRRTQNQTSRSSLANQSAGRRLSPSESANSLRHPDAGSGGTGDREYVQQGAAGPAGGWSMLGSRSASSLDMRMMSGRLASRETPNATPRPQTSARVR